MVGGQIMLLALVIMVIWFGVGPLQFAYSDQMRNMLSATSINIPASIVSATNVVNAAKTSNASAKST